MRDLVILGSTGSIGVQALEIVAANPGVFNVVAISAYGSNPAAIIEQARTFKVQVIGVVTNAEVIREALPGVTVIDGPNAASEIAAITCEVVLNGITGSIGLGPTLAALEVGNKLALANKESLVAGGDLVMSKAREHQIIPVDSEHSAIWQCALAGKKNEIRKLVLTASGGPFLGKKPNFLVNVKRDHALQHPNWSMGAKISIDSATLMNKGLEMIEAKWLFGLDPHQIKVVVHSQSIIHSMVQFEDGSIKAQMGLPDMKLPIQYAMAYPIRLANKFPRYLFDKPNQLSFDEPDVKTFRNLQLATDAMNRGGNAPCVLNAANEIAVYAFLKNRIGFLDMTELIERTLDKIAFIAHPTLDDYFETDGEARNFAASLIQL